MQTQLDLAGIFDSHAHYDQERFDADRESLLQDLFARGMCGIVHATCNPAEASKAQALAHQFQNYYYAAGFHPEVATDFSVVDLEQFLPFWQDQKCVAIGEIGLDYHWDTPKERQIPLFEAQLQAANQKNLPVILHSRDACQDTLAILKQHRPKGVMHCFSYSKEVAREVLDLGLYIGITGAVTFHNARKLTEVGAYVPADRLLIETDCPYMAPEPFRGKRCDSSMLVHTAARLANLRNTTPEILIAQTAQNAKRLFAIKD